MPPKGASPTRHSSRLLNAKHPRSVDESVSQSPANPAAPSLAPSDKLGASSGGSENRNSTLSSASTLLPGSTEEPLSNSSPRRLVQRLDSLRGGSSHGGDTARNLKYLPQKVSRRNQEEREALERSALALLEERQSEAAHARAAAERRARLGRDFRGAGRGWGGRGRPTRGASGGVARADRQVDPGDASGPWSGISHSNTTGRQVESGKDRGGLGMSATTRKTAAKFKQESGTNESTGNRKGNRTDIKENRQTRPGQSPPWSETHKEEQETLRNRRNIDYITISSDSDEGNDGNTSRRLKPVRLDRHEHIDRPIGVNTDASSARSAQPRQTDPTIKQDPSTTQLESFERVTLAGAKQVPQKGKDVEFLRDQRRWKGVYAEEEPPVSRVKEESQDRDVEMAGVPASSASGVQGDSSAPIRDAGITGLPTDEDPQEEEGRRSDTRRRKSTFQLRRPVLQTSEDQAEWDRYMENRMNLVDELSLDLEFPTESKDANLEDTDREEKIDNRQNRVYMFQLPPLIPNLVRFSPDKGDTQNQTQDHDHDHDLEAMSEMAVPENAPTVPSIPEPSTASVPIKLEDGSTAAQELNPDSLHAPDSPSFIGAVGTLTIYESGVSALSWGGVEHELNLGCAGELLQEVVVADARYPTDTESAASDAAQGERAGKGMAMGQLGGRFVVTPAWAGLFDRTS